jgi:hypothetical protein
MFKRRTQPNPMVTALTLGENAAAFMETLVDDLEAAVEASYDAESNADQRILNAEADKEEARQAAIRYGTMSTGLRALLFSGE